MARQTSMRVDKETKDRAELFQRAVGADSANEALDELLDIAAKEGHWDGDGEPMTISRERIEELESKQETLAQGLVDLRDQMNEHHGER